MNAKTHRLYVGTIGEGLWRSLDGGETFTRACDGVFVECHVRSLAVHPRDDSVLYLGSEQGLFRSEDGAGRWKRVDSPLDGLQIWSILLLPTAPEVILVGTCPSRLFRSGDGGRTWIEADARMRPDCPGIISSRVTALCAHSADPQTVWAGVEVDGLFRSRDGGQRFEPVGKGLSSPDIHSLAYMPDGGRLLASTNNDVNVSLDEGDTWQPLRLPQALPLPYFRNLAQCCGRPGERCPGRTHWRDRRQPWALTERPPRWPRSRRSAARARWRAPQWSARSSLRCWWRPTWWHRPRPAGARR